MHLNKCRDRATFGWTLFRLLATTCLLLAASPSAATESKQHNEQSTRLANLTHGANNTSARSLPLAPPPLLATSKRQINNVNSGRGAKAAGPASPPPPPSNNNQSLRLISKYKLPSWFHFNTFKQLYGKKYPGGYVDELHRRIYLRTSLKVFEQRALYRSGRLDSLASVNELSDLTGEQLDQFRALRKNSSAAAETARPPIKGAPPPSRQLPECCTYDQVYARIIGLLSAATNSNDSALSRALVDELEQKPLVESDRDEPIADLGRPPPLVKSTRSGPGENKAAARATTIPNIDDGREGREMIERRHRNDEIGEEEAKELQRGRAQQQLNNSTASRHHRKAGEQRAIVVAPATKSNLAPDHQTAAAAAAAAIEGRLRHARPATSAGWQTRPISASSNRSTTSAGSKLAAGNTHGSHSGPNDDEQDEQSAAELGVPKEIEEAVRAQVAEQLSSNSPLGRELSKQMSAYFGQPVEIRAVPATSSKQSGARKPKPVPKQQQQQQRQQQQQQQLQLQSAPSTPTV